jgi:hypothetical protein
MLIVAVAFRQISIATTAHSNKLKPATIKEPDFYIRLRYLGPFDKTPKVGFRGAMFIIEISDGDGSRHHQDGVGGLHLESLAPSYRDSRVLTQADRGRDPIPVNP